MTAGEYAEPGSRRRPAEGTGAPPGPTTSEHGLLGARRDFRLGRIRPSGDLAEWVERHWVVEWDLPEGRRSAATLLPHPCVNLVFVGARLMVAGVGRDRFTYPLAGRGRVYGVKFRPGGFHPYAGVPVVRLTERTVPLGGLWGEADVARIESALRDGGPVSELVTVTEEALRRRRPRADPNVALVSRITHTLLTDRSISRVDDAARRFGLSMRTLQRLFQTYVGVSPKWVLGRYRLHEAAARLAAGSPGSTWADVAAELGYFDQSHFIRDFTRAVGSTPADYAAACARGRMTALTT